ncbi:hypothetical protein GQ55_7G224300 [Panicum hallii var. hallii]|uniref:Uncharacterized protein n=1 Tax=Panicum hallii var. hallii TaxID=1504633 RepID=A0A2T7CXW7_9POAL|nr:hypothetical protein GQ55_7G224300 [Panicum hallii var. hallii]
MLFVIWLIPSIAMRMLLALEKFAAHSSLLESL